MNNASRNRAMTRNMVSLLRFNGEFAAGPETPKLKCRLSKPTFTATSWLAIRIHVRLCSQVRRGAAVSKEKANKPRLCGFVDAQSFSEHRSLHRPVL
jgi:hypothetical protein